MESPLSGPSGAGAIARENMFGSAAKVVDVKLASQILVSLFVAAAPAKAIDNPRNKLVVLHKSDIQSSVVGRWLVPDRNVKQSAFEFSEIFVADGTWRSSRQERALLMLEGSWKIKDDSLCVQITKAPWGNFNVGDIRCRTVWRNPVNGNVVMADIGSGGADAAIVELSTQL